MSHWARSRLIFASLAAVILSLLVFVAHRHFVMTGLQAEAKIMLTYIKTLETAYFTEYGKYIGFSDYYGAPRRGEDNCLQPDGAATLGFVVRWCHKEGPAPVRYAYRVILNDNEAEPNFSAEAVSGSDSFDESFVCFGLKQEDEWEVDKGGVVRRSRFCDP